MRPEALDECQIEKLVREHLVQNLQVVLENDLDVALHDFVDKVIWIPHWQQLPWMWRLV